MLKRVVAGCLLVGCCVLISSEAKFRKGKQPTTPNLSVVLHSSPERLWHHRGDELVVTLDEETLLRIRLDQASEGRIPLKIELGPRGRIQYWDKDFETNSFQSRLTKYAVLECNDLPIQGFKLMLWCSFDLGAGREAIVTLALPQNGFQYWSLRKIGDREATMTRTLDTCYLQMLNQGGENSHSGQWGPAAMNCILYTMVVDGDWDIDRHFQVSLPWPAPCPLPQS